MVDTVRTVGANQANLADNTTGDISPQDARDFLVSVYNGYTTGIHATPPTTGWSWDNQGSITESTTANGSLVYVVPAGGGDLGVRYRAHTSGDIHTAEIDGLTLSDHAGIGLAFRESSTGEITTLYIKPFSATVLVENWTTSTTFSATTINQTLGGAAGTRFWFQVEDNATNLIFRISTSGMPNSYIDIHSEGRTTFMAGGPDGVGIVLRDNAVLRATVFSFGTT